MVTSFDTLSKSIFKVIKLSHYFVPIILKYEYSRNLNDLVGNKSFFLIGFLREAKLPSFIERT